MNIPKDIYMTWPGTLEEVWEDENLFYEGHGREYLRTWWWVLPELSDKALASLLDRFTQTKSCDVPRRWSP